MNTSTTALDLDPFKRRMQFRLLKHAAGHSVFCPACGEIMDCKRTVLVELYVTVAGKSEGHIATYTQCGKCWDKRKEKFAQITRDLCANPQIGAARIEVLDGRDPKFAKCR